MGLRDDKEILTAALDSILNGTKPNARSSVMDGIVQFLGGRPASVEDFQRWVDVAKYAMEETDNVAKGRLINVIGNHSKKEVQDIVYQALGRKSMTARELADKCNILHGTVFRALHVLRYERKVYICDYRRGRSSLTHVFRVGEGPDKPRPPTIASMRMLDKPSIKLMAERILKLMPDGEPVDRHKIAVVMGITPTYASYALQHLVDSGRAEMVGLKRLTKQYQKKAQ